MNEQHKSKKMGAIWYSVVWRDMKMSRQRRTVASCVVLVSCDK